MALPNIDWKKLNEILGSQGMQTALGITGAALTAKAQADMADRQLQQRAAEQGSNALQNRAAMLQRMREAEEANQMRRAEGVLSATRLGENENFATRNRILRALLPAVANQSPIRPGDPAVAAAMGSGGLDLRGLVRPEMFEALSDEATAAAIAQRSQNLANLDPSAVMPDLQAMGLDPSGSRQDLMNRYASNRLAEAQAEKKRTQDLIMAALDEDLNNSRRPAVAPEGYEYDKKTGELKKKGGGFWKTLGKIGAIAAPIVAAPFTGGTSLALIGAGSGAAQGLLDGGGLKGALLGGGLGAVTAGMGPSGGGKAALGAIAKSPQTWARGAGQVIGGPVGTAMTLGGMFLPGPQLPQSTRLNNTISPEELAAVQNSPMRAAPAELMELESRPMGLDFSNAVQTPRGVAPQRPDLPAPRAAQAAPRRVPLEQIAPVASHTSSPVSSVDAAFSKATGIGANPNPPGMFDRIMENLSQQPLMRVLRSPQAQVAMGGAAISSLPRATMPGGGLIPRASGVPVQTARGTRVVQGEVLNAPAGELGPGGRMVPIERMVTQIAEQMGWIKPGTKLTPQQLQYLVNVLRSQ